MCPILWYWFTDYPIKSNKYIKEYLYKKYPTNFFAFLSFDELETYGKKIKKMYLSDRNNYWLSFLHSKFKLEIKPFCFMRPRCFKGQIVPIIDKNPYIYEIGKYIHNPEEILLQTIINTIEKEISRKDYLVNCEQRLRKNGSLEITDDDKEVVLEKMSENDWLFMRKFSSVKSKKILDFIDKENEK